MKKLCGQVPCGIEIYDKFRPLIGKPRLPPRTESCFFPLYSNSIFKFSLTMTNLFAKIYYFCPSFLISLQSLFGLKRKITPAKRGLNAFPMGSA